jgi:hypothetical protein
MKELIHLLSNHGTKIIGYVAAAAGALTLMDKAMVIKLLGPTAPDWALLIAGVLAIFRGHTVNKVPKPAEPVTPTNGAIP